jgi:hypothetical protein
MQGNSQHPLILKSQQGLCDDEILFREIPRTPNLLGISATNACEMIRAPSSIRAQFPKKVRRTDPERKFPRHESSHGWLRRRSDHGRQIAELREFWGVSPPWQH